MFVIEVRNLWFRYDEKWILKNINLKIKKGESVAVVGPTGSGKTTLVKHFNGILKPTKGKVLVKGKDTRELHASEISKMVGYVFQNPLHQIFSPTVLEEIGFALRIRNVEDWEEKVKRISKKFGLESKLKLSPLSISAGEKEKTAISSVLIMDPEILVFDEPTIGQDYQIYLTIKNLIEELKRDGKTVVLISHDMEMVAECCEKIIGMKNGEVVFNGSVEEFFENVKLVEDLNMNIPTCVKLSRLLNGKPILQIQSFLEEIKNEVRTIR